MTSATLREALSRATDTVDAAVGRGVLAEAGRRIVAQLGDGAYLVVADENTWALGGERLTEVLVEAGAAVADPLIFPGRPVLYASYDNCVTIKQAMGDALPIALGSGTRLFGEGERAKLTLERSLATTTGVLITEYAVERAAVAAVDTGRQD